MADGGEERVECELPRGQTFDDAHGRATTRARPRRPWRHERFVRRCRGDGEGLPTLSEFAGTTARREEAEVADADEAFREDVEEKPSQEFVGRECERSDLAPVPVVLPPKGNRVVGDGDEPVI